MTTKKTIKNSLKYLLQAEKLGCDSCRNEIKQFMDDFGTAIKAGDPIEMSLSFDGSHVVYQNADHSAAVIMPEKGGEKKEKTPEQLEALKAKRKARREARKAKKKAAAGEGAPAEDSEVVEEIDE